MGSSSDPLMEIVSSATIGRAVGVSGRRITQLRDEGRIPGVDGGKFVLGDAIAAYCAAIRPASGSEAAGGSDVGNALDAARVRHVTAQAIARELLNDQLRGDAVLAEDLETVVGATFDAVRQRLLAIPVTAAARVIGLTNKVEIQEQVSLLVNEALAELAAVEVIGTIKDRARRRAGRTDLSDDNDAE